MSFPVRTIELYIRMMAAQRRGTFTEHNLLDFLPHFWYNGDTSNEYYTEYYISKRSRRV